jgi:hypothetical protein
MVNSESVGCGTGDGERVRALTSGGVGRTLQQFMNAIGCAHIGYFFN